MRKVAVFVDMENIRKDIEVLQAKDEKARSFHYFDVKMAASLFKRTFTKNEEIFRVYLYNSVFPSMEDVKQQISSRSDIDRQLFFKVYRERNYDFDKIHEMSSKFLHHIAMLPQVEVRFGKLIVVGQRPDGTLIFSQKRIDTLLTLDIAHVSSSKIVDEVRIFSKDTDMIPAIEYAKRNGVLTSVVDIKGIRLPPSIKKACDFTYEAIL